LYFICFCPITFWGAIKSTKIVSNRVHPFRPVLKSYRDRSYLINRRWETQSIFGNVNRPIPIFVSLTWAGWDHKIMSKFASSPRLGLTKTLFENIFTVCPSLSPIFRYREFVNMMSSFVAICLEPSAPLFCRPLRGLVPCRTADGATGFCYFLGHCGTADISKMVHPKNTGVVSIEA
jgi:hypothetical protein